MIQKGSQTYMKIRHASLSDLAAMQQIYACAREQMRQNGNPSQWGNSSPATDILLRDIRDGNSYLLLTDDRPCGAFSLLTGDDPTYAVIEDGHWPNDLPYGTIHRLAGDGTAGGIFRACLAFCESVIPNLRADTHPDNHIMRHLLESNGFMRCGIIYVEDKTPRIAYQKTV